MNKKLKYALIIFIILIAISIPLYFAFSCDMNHRNIKKVTMHENGSVEYECNCGNNFFTFDSKVIMTPGYYQDDNGNWVAPVNKSKLK